MACIVKLISALKAFIVRLSKLTKATTGIQNYLDLNELNRIELIYIVTQVLCDYRQGAAHVEVRRL